MGVAGEGGLLEGGDMSMQHFIGMNHKHLLVMNLQHPVIPAKAGIQSID